MKKLSVLALAVICLGGVGQTVTADTVVWTIDSQNSFVRLNIPDQNIEIPSIPGSPILEAGLRGFSGDLEFPIQPGPWSDDRGRRSFVDGTIVTEYVDGVSIEFVQGEHTAAAVQADSFYPNSDIETLTDDDPFGTEPSPGSFGAVLVALPNAPDGGLPIGFAAFRGIEYDLSGNVGLQPSGGGWTNTDSFEIGLLAATLDAIVIAVDREDTHGVVIDPLLETNSGGLTIEDLGGDQRKITVVINIPIEIDVDEVPLQASITGVIVAFATVPAAANATIVDSFVSHGGYSGQGSAIDTGKSLAKEGVGAGTLSFSNLINTSRGINGIIFDVQGLANGGALTAADFEFQVSPQGAFNEGANPPSGWAAAPAPSSISVTAGSPDRVLIQWANQSIVNRWLRVTVKATANTGLAAPEVYYLGHMLGECTGLSGTVFTVAFADITAIRNKAGQTVDASSVEDIDKNGTVSFADINVMRANVGNQLTNITIP
jgi:hypothetical protein